MQNKKELTASFRKMLRGRTSKKVTKSYALWLTQMDISEGQIFQDEEEEQIIKKKLRAQIDHHFIEPIIKNSIRHVPNWISFAAAAVFILVLTLLFTQDLKKPNNLAFKLVTTKAGERKIIRLSDGSKVTLNNSSRITFPVHFTKTDRKVSLDGEAFFDIAHEADRPFIVSTDKLAIQVLGTSFNIHSYIPESDVVVTVATGKVGIRLFHKKQNWMLTPGQQLSYQKKTGQAIKIQVDPNDYTGWQKGELIFKNETLNLICKRLERWYGVTIQIETSTLKTKRINLEQKEESLDNVLKMLSLVADFKYEIKGKEVQIWSYK